MKTQAHGRSHALLFALLLALAATSAHANTIAGKVRYQDKTFSTIDGSVLTTPMLPARYVTLDFVRASNLTTVLGSTTTDASGDFASPDVGAPADLVILVKAMGVYQGQLVVVRDQSAGGGAIQTFQSAEFDLSGGNLSGQTIDITADAISGAFNIFDCLVSADEYVRGNLFATPPAATNFQLTVRWEEGLDTEGGGSSASYFTVVGGNMILNLLGDPAVDNDAFDDSVIIHEYGHVVAYLYSKDDSPGGAHTLGDALDLRLAFSEGWADFFSSAARSTEWYIDTNADTALIFEIATPAVNGAPGLDVSGADNELAVAAILWDIIHSAITVANGAIDTPREALWDVFDNYLPAATVLDRCLEDLWDGFFESASTPAYGVGANQTILNAIIAAHGVKYFADDSEPNDTAATAATLLTNGTTILGTHYADPDGDGIGNGDVDWFAFTAEQDQTYTIETYDLGPEADTVLQLYATDAATLLANHDNRSASDLSSKIVWKAPANGTYYVRITRSTSPLPIVGSAPNGVRANYGHYSLKATLGGLTSGPTVVMISPYDGATGVVKNTTVIAAFSQPVKAATVTTASFTLKNGAAAVPGTVALDASRTIATFTPADRLANETTYTVELTAAILDDADRALTAFTSTFTTGSTVAPPAGPVPRVPRAQIASGDGYVEVEWVYPDKDHDGVIVAYGRERFPRIGLVDGALVITDGTEVYRGNTETSVDILTANGERAFVSIWTFTGTDISEPYNLWTRASQGGQGIIDHLDPDEVEATGAPTLPKPAKFQAVSGDGFVDVEWVSADHGDEAEFDGVIVAVGSTTFPKLEQVVENGTTTLRVTRGTELYRNNNRVRFRLATVNGEKRLFCVWTYRGIEYSKPLYAATRASRGGRGLLKPQSFYGDAYEEPTQLP